MADALSTKIDALISGAPDALSLAADSVANIQSGNDVLASNFDHVEEVFDNLQAFLTELKSGSWYAPVGLISPFGGLSASVPAGWLLCDGSSVSQTTYAALYGVLGANAYGSDAGGNFVLPDLRGRVPFGLNADNGDVDSRLDNENASTTNRSPKHKHTISSLSVNSASVSHAHSYRSPWYDSENPYVGGAGTNAYVVNTASGRSYGGDRSLGTGSDSISHSHGLSGSVGVGSGANDTVPYVVTNYIIKY